MLRQKYDMLVSMIKVAFDDEDDRNIVLPYMLDYLSDDFRPYLKPYENSFGEDALELIFDTVNEKRDCSLFSDKIDTIEMCFNHIVALERNSQ